MQVLPVHRAEAVSQGSCVALCVCVCCGFCGEQVLTPCVLGGDGLAAQSIYFVVMENVFHKAHVMHQGLLGSNEDPVTDRYDLKVGMRVQCHACRALSLLHY